MLVADEVSFETYLFTKTRKREYLEALQSWIMSRLYITKIEDVPDFDAMMGEEVVEWLEDHELSYELQVKLFPETTLEEDYEEMG